MLDSYGRESPRVAIGEIHIFDWQELASYYGQELDELHLPFNFRLLGIPWQAQAIRAGRRFAWNGLPPEPGRTMCWAITMSRDWPHDIGHAQPGQQPCCS